MSIFAEERQSDYMKYRGRCKELCEALIKENPDLEIVRGYYHEPIWNTKEQHFWCKDKSGNIIDPTRKQFPSGGMPEYYEEFNGVIECSECGKRIKEEDADMAGNYPVCSQLCAYKLVGLV